MSFWNKLGNLFKSKQKADSWQGPHYNFSSWANLDFPGLSDKGLESSEEVFSVITRLANTISSLPLHEFKKYKEVDTPVSDLLRVSANPSMSAFELLNQLEVSRNETGNGYALIERNSLGVPVNLWPINPDTVVVKRDVDTNDIWYQISFKQKSFLVYNTDIIHVKHISPLTSFVGISPLDVLRGSLEFAKAVEDFSLSEMKKKDQYIIEYDRSIDKEKRQALIDDLLQMIKENGGAVVQERGFKINRYESKFQPGDLQTTADVTRKRIANAFNVPLSFLGENNNNGKSNESLMTQFVEMTLLPIVKQYEAEFNRKLLTQNQRSRGFYFKFNVNGLMRGDTQARTAFYQMMIRNGIATPNDLRKLEDLPLSNEKNADKLWFSKDLALLEEADKINAPNSDDSTSKGGEELDDDQAKENKNAGIPNNQTGSKHTNDSQYVH